MSRLERAFRRRGIQYSLGVRFQQATQDDTSVSVTLEDGTELTADYLLVAVGRGPATADLGFEEAGVVLDRGFVTVDEELRTGVPGCGRSATSSQGSSSPTGASSRASRWPSASPASPRDGPRRADPEGHVLQPEVASVGLTEAAVAAHGADAVSSYEYNLAGNGKSEIIGTGGLVKVVRQKDGPVLGVHLIGDRVGELITEGQLAVAWEAHPRTSLRSSMRTPRRAKRSARPSSRWPESPCTPSEHQPVPESLS